MTHAGEASPAERYLQAWHVRHPDASRVFIDARDADGHSSYERLASLVTRGQCVLDIACGTGSLLALIATGSGSQQVGVDLSFAELRGAQSRSAEFNLSCSRGQALPFRAASIDVVLCHMALMLMDDPAQVLVEARRVLRTGGVLSAITNRSGPGDPATMRILRATRPLFAHSNEALRPPQLGDPRTLEANAFVALASDYFSDVRVETFDVIRHVARDDLWQFLVESLYGFDAIPANEGVRLLIDLELPDVVQFAIPMLQVYGRA